MLHIQWNSELIELHLILSSLARIVILDILNFNLKENWIIKN